MKPLNALLVFIPVAIVLDRTVDNPILVFVTWPWRSTPAGLMGDATEALAEYLGPTLGLLNATLGSAPRSSCDVALHRGLIDMVKASLTGSIVGNLLFGLGASMVAGGFKVRDQKFDWNVARMNGALLTLASFGLIIPAIYRLSPLAENDPGPEVSLEISAILFLVYLASLVFTLVTSKAVVGQAGVKAEKVEAGTGRPGVEPEQRTGWGRNQALGILIVVTIALAIMSEVLTGQADPRPRKCTSRSDLRASSCWPWSAMPQSCSTRFGSPAGTRWTWRSASRSVPAPRSRSSSHRSWSSPVRSWGGT